MMQEYIIQGGSGGKEPITTMEAGRFYMDCMEGTELMIYISHNYWWNVGLGGVLYHGLQGAHILSVSAVMCPGYNYFNRFPCKGIAMGGIHTRVLWSEGAKNKTLFKKKKNMISGGLCSK